jgi:hypothetical protein
MDVDDVFAQSSSGKTALDYWLLNPRSADCQVLQKFWSKNAVHGNPTNRLWRIAEAGDVFALSRQDPKFGSLSNHWLHHPKAMQPTEYIPARFALTMAELVPPGGEAGDVLGNICRDTDDPYFAVHFLLARSDMVWTREIIVNAAIRLLIWCKTSTLETLELLLTYHKKILTGETQAIGSLLPRACQFQAFEPLLSLLPMILNYGPGVTKNDILYGHEQLKERTFSLSQKQVLFSLLTKNKKHSDGPHG